jgi:hypothetical protein
MAKQNWNPPAREDRYRGLGDVEHLRQHDIDLDIIDYALNTIKIENTEQLRALTSKINRLTAAALSLLVSTTGLAITLGLTHVIGR